MKLVIINMSIDFLADGYMYTANVSPNGDIQIVTELSDVQLAGAPDPESIGKAIVEFISSPRAYYEARATKPMGDVL